MSAAGQPQGAKAPSGGSEPHAVGERGAHMNLAWVVGAGGLLGSALTRALQREGTPLFAPKRPLAWQDAALLHRQLQEAVHDFAAQVAGAPGWTLHWAAGVGSMGSSAEALAPETAALQALLQALEAEGSLLQAPGALALASSAGAIYAGSRDRLITETSAEAPTSPYAHEKLAQEALLLRFVARHPGQRALLARITTLYGLGSNPQKPIGLLSHIARSVLRNRPVHIYVPFDTQRDYLGADDAATAMLAALRQAWQVPAQAHVKLVASEQPVTIAEIIALFQRIARRAPRVVTSVSRLSGLYPQRARFRSQALLPARPAPATPLAVGIAGLMAAERLAYQRGERTPRAAA